MSISLCLLVVNAPITFASLVSTKYLLISSNINIPPLKKCNMKPSISEYFSVLTERQKDILTKIHLEGYTFDEVAIMYNVSRQAANFAASKGIKKIKQVFASESE